MHIFIMTMAQFVCRARSESMIRNRKGRRKHSVISDRLKIGIWFVDFCRYEQTIIDLQSEIEFICRFLDGRLESRSLPVHST